MNSRKETAIILVYQRLYGKSETPVYPRRHYAYSDEIHVEVCLAHDYAIAVRLSRYDRTFERVEYLGKEDFYIKYDGQVKKMSEWEHWMLKYPGLTLFHTIGNSGIIDLIFERGDKCSITINSKKVILPDHIYTKALEQARECVRHMFRQVIPARVDY
jgi:hypothetical protein